MANTVFRIMLIAIMLICVIGIAVWCFTRKYEDVPKANATFLLNSESGGDINI